MNPDWWHRRWRKGEIGFHQREYNEHMQLFMGHLQLQPGAHVFVPLCGKSLDMIWLREQGYRVTGVELSRQAVEDFSRENDLAFKTTELPGAILYSSADLVIYCGDFFTVDFTGLDPIDAVYDRASLIALPPEMRTAYVERLTSLLTAGTPTLLLSLDYPQQEMSGPPFSVMREEIEKLYGARYEIEPVHSTDCLAREPKFRDRGLSRLDEQVYVLRNLV